MKIDNKEFLNPQQQLYQNTKDIEDLKEKYKGEIYAALPTSEWPEDVVLEQVDDPREFTYVPRAITNVPADAKYGYFLMNVEDFEDPSNSAALLFKIKSVNNSTVYIEFYANVASHVPGPQGETGPQGPQGIQGPQGEPGQTTIGIEVVAELPATGEEGVIYFVPKQDSETGDEYDEYTYVNDDWELLGGATVDLTNYALKSEIPVIDEDLIPKAFNTYVLGDNTHSYKEVVANKFKSPNSYYEISGVNVSGHGSVSIKTTDGNGTSEAQIQLGNTALYSNRNIAPLSGSTVNLGQAANGFNNLYLDGKIVTDDNLTYGFTLPDTTNYTADKTLATTDQIPTLPNYNITNVVTDNSEVLGMQIYNTSAGISYNFYNTNPNPTLAGTESNLTSIDIGGTSYKIPSFSGNYNDLTNKPTLGTAAAADTGTSSGDVPVLDSNGKLSTSVLPAIAVTDTFVVSSEAAMLALTAQVGDVAVRTDLNKSFILQTDGASTLSHWQELLTPTDSVTSVNGQTGAVTLTIPTNSDYVDLTSNQNINGTKGFTNLQAKVPSNSYNPRISFIGYNGDTMYLSADPTTSNKFTFSFNGIYNTLSTPDLYNLTSDKTLATTDQIPNIVYSATQPSNPVEGMIWIAPAS